MRTRVRSDGWCVPLSYLLSFDCRMPSRVSSSRCVQPRSSRRSRRRAPIALLKTLGCGLGLAPEDAVLSFDDFPMAQDHGCVGNKKSTKMNFFPFEYAITRLKLKTNRIPYLPRLTPPPP